MYLFNFISFFHKMVHLIPLGKVTHWGSWQSSQEVISIKDHLSWFDSRQYVTSRLFWRLNCIFTPRQLEHFKYIRTWQNIWNNTWDFNFGTTFFFKNYLGINISYSYKFEFLILFNLKFFKFLILSSSDEESLWAFL
jgi:hypothetical protein